MKHIVHAAGACVVAAAIAACGAPSDKTGSGEPVATTEQGVSVTAITTNPQITIANDGSPPIAATGAVFVPILSGGVQQTLSTSLYGSVQLRDSCGVTFVSPHYAITSSHCFPDTNVPNPASQTFGVWSYNVAGANVDSFYTDALMEGTFPNYAPIFGQNVNQVPGYTATGVTCSIASRCAGSADGQSASAYNCAGVSAPDITMLYCADRSDFASWLTITEDPNVVPGIPVYLYWFNELFTPQTGSADMQAHYTDVTNPLDPTQNWHYLGTPSNVFVPLMPVPWPGGYSHYKYGLGSDNDVLTDLYGCHGASGSGVFEINPNDGVWQLLGPVHAYGSAWGTTSLCDDPVALQPGAAGGHGLTYSSNTSVNNLASGLYGSALAYDRIPHYRR